MERAGRHLRHPPGTKTGPARRAAAHPLPNRNPLCGERLRRELRASSGPEPWLSPDRPRDRRLALVEIFPQKLERSQTLYRPLPPHPLSPYSPIPLPPIPLFPLIPLPLIPYPLPLFPS